VLAKGSGYVLEYRAQKGTVESRRTLVLDSCEAAREAAVLLLLLTLDPILAESLGASRVVEQAEAPGPPSVPTAEVTPTPLGPVNSAASAGTTRPAKGTTHPSRAPLKEAAGRGWVPGGWLAMGGSLVSSLTARAKNGLADEADDADGADEADEAIDDNDGSESETGAAGAAAD
jgi:hypothetical protein